MRNNGSSAETFLESIALIADNIRKNHCSHDYRAAQIEVIGNMLEVQESHNSGAQLQALYALHQILNSIGGNYSRTHTEVKHTLNLFSQFARACKADFEAKRKAPEKYQDNIPF